MTTIAAAIDGRALWYLTRGTGAVSLLLLTLSVVLGIADVRRLTTPRLPRFVVDGLHQTVSLLVIVTLVIHIATTLLDSFAPIRVVDVLVPFVSAYRPVWIGFGALALDLLLAVAVTSIIRARLGYRAWRAVHWLAYACWPVAFLHGLGSGSDIRGGFAFFLSLGCALVVAIAIVARLLGTEPYGRVAGGVAALVAAGLGLAIWLPAGPLAPGWAARAGTPPAVLAAAHGRAPAPTAARVLSGRVVAGATGRVHQTADPNGRAVVRFTLGLDRGPLRRLRVNLDGQALPGGGVSLSQGRVELGAATGPAVYTGPVSALQGGQLTASLRARAGSGASLALALQIRPNSDQVTGRATLVPVAAR